jgi:phosphate regulon transcriptional regulator PhoB
MASRVLIVDDEPDIRDLLAWHLERDGYRVSRAADGAQALREIAAQAPDLILLDLMLPGVGGLELCRRLRGDPATAGLPVIMLTARGDEVDRVVGLEVGADDYVVKPFSPKEVLARVRAVLRRAGGQRTGARLGAGAIALDPATHEATVAGMPLTLTPKEFDLLRALLEARGRVLSREFLLDRVWGYARAGELESRTVDVHIRRLRAKLGDEGRRIVTVKSAGYRLEPEEPPPAGPPA